jgi:hypothetical protein
MGKLVNGKLKMEILKNFKIVLLILLAVLVLVIVKSTSKFTFKQDVQDIIAAIESNNFLVSMQDLKGSESQYLIVNLGEPGTSQFENSLKIPYEKLLEESYLQQLKETEKKILLWSDDNSVAVKGWVILNQLGFKNVLVLSEIENPEVLKYEFKADTVRQ